MRDDFGKVIIEAPRHGSGWARSAKARSYGRITQDSEGYDYDGLQHLPATRKQEGYHKKLGDKSFSDVLGPMRKYLKSRCGLPWNDTYSEIKRVLGDAPWGVQHIITAHLDVATCTYRGIDGHVWVCDKHGVKRIDKTHYYSLFYVEPETGLLREAPRRRYSYKKEADPDVIPIGDREEYRKINGIWHHRTWATIEEVGPINQTGRWIKRPERDLKELVLWEKKRQLGKKQLKELRLKNG